MILGKAPSKNLFKKTLEWINFRKIPTADIHNRSLIGNRDWVGWGMNGTPNYVDNTTVPFPAIRFKENSNELLALREKEKGDWRKLTDEEKKILYRASFRQTFSEMNAPTGEWKSILGSTLFLVSLAFWMFTLTKCFAFPSLPSSFSEEARRAQFRRMLVEMQGHITGLSSKWDYELDDWKK